MRHSIERLALTVLALALGAGPLPAQGRSADSPRVEALEWMAGCWAFTSGAREVHEQWMAPAGGVMLGMSRAMRNGQVDSLEFVVLRGGGAGLAYEAIPLSQKPTVFPLVKLGEREAVFENVSHDFPQRIIYRREGDRLLARIEGPQGGETKGFDYPYERVACP